MRLRFGGGEGIYCGGGEKRERMHIYGTARGGDKQRERMLIHDAWGNHKTTNTDVPTDLSAASWTTATRAPMRVKFQQ